MLEDRTTRLLKRWIPVVVLVNLSVAAAAFKLHWPATPIYVMLALTIAGSIVAAVLYLGSVRGVQSAQALGFRRTRDAAFYGMSGRTTSFTPIFLFAASAVVWAYAGASTAPAILAFFTIPLIGIYQAATARYPVDHQHEALVVAQTIREFLDGSGGEWDWDDFLSWPLRNAELEDIRRKAATIELPAGDDGRAALEALAEAAGQVARS